MQKFEKHHDYLWSNGVFMREELAWGDFVYSDEHLHYTSEWLQKRIQNLDLRFNNLCVTVNTEPNEAISKVEVFPNPADGIVSVKHPRFAEAQPLALCDLTGKIILTQFLGSETSTVNITHLKPGCYYVKVGSQKPVKFIKR